MNGIRVSAMLVGIVMVIYAAITTSLVVGLLGVVLFCINQHMTIIMQYKRLVSNEECIDEAADALEAALECISIQKDLIAAYEGVLNDAKAAVANKEEG